MADAVKVSGTISHLSEEQQVTEKMRKRLVVVTTEGQYPEQIAVEFVNDRIDLTSGLTEGQQVNVYYNLKGREWQGRYFVSLSGWKVEDANGAAPAPAQAATANKNPPLRATAQPVTEPEGDGLPF